VILPVWSLALVCLSAAAQPSDPTTVLVLTGDNLLGGRMGDLVSRYGEGYAYEMVKGVLRKADIAFGNLECPITDFPHRTLGKSAQAVAEKRDFVFRASPAYSSRILQDAGIDVVSLANNHTMDYQAQGLLDTIAHLKRAGIVSVGGGANRAEAASSRIVRRNGMRVGFLAYSMIVPHRSAASERAAGINAHAKGFSAEMETAIRQLRKNVDWVLVSIHWGKEGSTQPEKYQVEVAHRAIEAGADVIVGHHPHRIQGIEFYRGGVIFYSLGNFLFPGSRRVESFLAEVTLSKKKEVAVRLLPLWVSGGRPVPSSDATLLTRIRQVVGQAGARIEADGSWLRVRK
jgi:poly-gamma-glutamate synthesis protein (capsule biosynthesis protein)